MSLTPSPLGVKQLGINTLSGGSIIYLSTLEQLVILSVTINLSSCSSKSVKEKFITLVVPMSLVSKNHLVSSCPKSNPTDLFVAVKSKSFVRVTSN